MMAILLIVVISVLFNGVFGHGRLLEPPSRPSMWRVGFNNPRNYNDNQLFCGGKTTQFELNGGKCGVCGDVYNGSASGDHEAGGMYANGIIGRSFKKGQMIDVIVEITANHLGWMEFNLCPVNDPRKKATEECLLQHPLIPEGSTTSQIPVTAQMIGALYLKLQLPKDIECVLCVLRWKYVAGNSWGIDKSTGQSCQGCGNQEQFYSCADVTIGDTKPNWDTVNGINPQPQPIINPLAQPISPPTQLIPEQDQQQQQQQHQEQKQPPQNGWGSSNYQKYAHLYYKTEPITLPTTTKLPKSESGNIVQENVIRKTNAVAASVPYVSSIVKSKNDNKYSGINLMQTTTTSTTKATTMPEAETIIAQSSPVSLMKTAQRPIVKTLSDFQLGLSWLFSNKNDSSTTTEAATLRPVPSFGDFKFSSIEEKDGITPSPIIVKPNENAVIPKKKKLKEKKKNDKANLVQSVIKGDISWTDLVQIMKKSTTPSVSTASTITEEIRSDRLVSVLTRGSAESSLPYVPPLLRSAADDKSRSAENDELSEDCTVLMIGEENGEPTYLAVCDEKK